MPTDNDKPEAVRLVVPLRPDVWRELQEAQRKLDFDKAGRLAAEVLRIWLTEYTGRNLPADELEPVTVDAKPDDKVDQVAGVAVADVQPAVMRRVHLRNVPDNVQAEPVFGGRVLDLPDEDELAQRQAEGDRNRAEAQALVERLTNGDRHLHVAPDPDPAPVPACVRCGAEAALIPCADCGAMVCNDCRPGTYADRQDVDDRLLGRGELPDPASCCVECTLRRQDLARRNTVTVRVPPRNPQAWKCWAKLVTAVNPDARNGYAFDGDWLRRGDAVDLVPGSVILVADDLGDPLRRNLQVMVYRVANDGDLVNLAFAQGNRWAAVVRDQVAEAVNL